MIALSETSAAYADWRLTHSGRADRGPVGGANMTRTENRVKQISRSNGSSDYFCNSLKRLRLRVGTSRASKRDGDGATASLGAAERCACD
jgi:hypothetical protein